MRMAIGKEGREQDAWVVAETLGETQMTLLFRTANNRVVRIAIDADETEDFLALIRTVSSKLPKTRD